MRTSLIMLLLAMGCGDTPVVDVSTRGDAAPESEVFGLRDGTAEGEGLLRFVNEASTTMAVLDHDVPLDRRAAAGIIGFKHGRDGRASTRDDRTFDSVDEIDAVRWVGPKSMERLLAYAHAHDWIPGADDLLGRYDGVDFTVTEAEWTLEIANSASHEELDVDLGLDRRAADSIAEAQPIDTVRELSGLYFVGKAALLTLKNEGIAQFYEEPEAEDVDCSPVLTPIEDEAASEFTELMALTTTVDNPWSRAFSLQLSGCPAFPEDDEAVALVTQALWNATYIWSWGELTDRFRVIHPIATGTARYQRMVDQSIEVIAEHLEDEDFDPADPAIAPLYDARLELADDLKDATTTGSWIELRTEVDMIECSEDSSAAFNLATGRVQVIHKLQNC